MNKKQTRAAIVEMVAARGANVTNWSTYEEVLGEYGLQPADVTAELLAEATEQVRKRITQSFSLPRRRPVRLECLAVGSHFETPHGALRGVVLDSNQSECKIALSVDGKTEEKRWSPATEVVPVAAGSDNVNGETISPKPERCGMQVEEQSLRKLMRALGKPEHKWTPVRLLTKLDKIRFVEILNDCKEPTEQDDMDLLRSISDALSEGETIEFKVEQVAEADTNGEPNYAEGTTNGDPIEDSKERKTKKKKVKAGKDKTVKTIKESKVTKPVRAKKSKQPPQTENGMSGLEAAAKVLQESGKPMHYREITEEVIAKGYWRSSKSEKPQNNIKSALLGEIHKKGKQSRFKKTGRGLFAIR